MPTSPQKARKLLDEDKAKVVNRKPFTIKLKYTTGENKQEVVAGMDTGSKKLGCAAIANGKVVYQSEVKLRDDIKRKMTKRRTYRRTRRNRLRYREPRWENRASMRKEGRLAPSLRSKVDSHLREKKFVESILPVTEWKVELAKFDIHKIKNPYIGRWDYQNGDMKGYYNVKAYVLDRDDYTCQECGATDTQLHIHHIVYKSNGGTDRPDNLTTLCEECHDKVHNDEISIEGKQSRTKHATKIGVIKSFIEKEFGEFEKTYGYETKFKREQILELPKEHYFDAVAICCTEGEVVELSDVVYKKRHVSKGDYQQTKGKRSEKNIPTGKVHGLRKFDYIDTEKGKGFVKGRMSSGYCVLGDIENNTIVSCVTMKRNVNRLIARNGCLVKHSSPRRASEYSA
ncbi:MAG: HNH endonuclease [Clostridiales bacterium]|nr:HNH endonuclease [Clostridiales bacterium]